MCTCCYNDMTSVHQMGIYPPAYSKCYSGERGLDEKRPQRGRWGDSCVHVSPTLSRSLCHSSHAPSKGKWDHRCVVGVWVGGFCHHMLWESLIEQGWVGNTLLKTTNKTTQERRVEDHGWKRCTGRFSRSPLSCQVKQRARKGFTCC